MIKIFKNIIKKLVKVIFFFYILSCINSFNLFSEDKLILLSKRTDFKIDLATRNYFGLFPTIENYKSAELFKTDENEYFFKIKTNDDEQIVKTNNSIITELQNYIENHEDIIDMAIVKSKRISSNLKPFYVKINTILNTQKDSIIIKLFQNEEEIKRFLVLINDSLIVVSKSKNLNNFKNMQNNFEIYYFNEIEYIKAKSTYIIEGEKELYNIHLDDIQEFSIFYKNNLSCPYEIVRLIMLDSFKIIKKLSPKFDIEKIYHKNFEIGAGLGLYKFLFDELPTKNIVNNKFISGFQSKINLFTRVYFNYIPTNFLGFGISYSKSDITLAPKGEDSNMTIYNIRAYFVEHNISLEFKFNFWNSGKYNFSIDQYIYSIFTQISMSYFPNKINPVFDNRFQNITNLTVSNDALNNYSIYSNFKYSVSLGLDLRYQVSLNNFINLRTFYTFHNDFGMIITNYYTRSKYINYLSSLKIEFGTGVKF